MKPYYQDSACTIYHGDALDILRELPEQSVNCCVTSPPYWGLRDYGVEGQLGLESTPDEYVAKMVAVFRAVRRVMRDDGTLWLNLGDSYAGSWGNAYSANRGNGTQRTIAGNSITKNADTDRHGSYVPPGARGFPDSGIKPKDLVGIPWRVAFALQADGWYLRQDIIWHKPNPMPESVTDRCTKSHEYIFLLSKSAKYWYDAEAIKEPLAESSIDRLAQNLEGQKGSERVPGKTNGNMKAVRFGGTKYGDDDAAENRTKSGKEWENATGLRNKRSVWTVTTKPYKEAHFATFPSDLILPCILAGCPKGGTVLDCFGGSGTTAYVSREQGRKSVLCELKAEYIELEKSRLQQEVLAL